MKTRNFKSRTTIVFTYGKEEVTLLLPTKEVIFCNKIYQLVECSYTMKETIRSILIAHSSDLKETAAKVNELMVKEANKLFIGE